METIVGVGHHRSPGRVVSCADEVAEVQVAQWLQPGLSHTLTVAMQAKGWTTVDNTGGAVVVCPVGSPGEQTEVGLMQACIHWI